MADGGDGLVCGEELARDLKNAGIQADVLRCASAGDEQAFVFFGFNLIEVGGKREVVAAKLGVGLFAQEIVNSGCYGVSCALLGAYRINLVAQHGKRLEGDHRFVIFSEIAAKQQNLLGHGSSSFW